MKWQELSNEEVQGLEYSTRPQARESQYRPLLETVKEGKAVRVDLDGVSAKSMSQRLYASAKNMGVKVQVRQLKDKSGVVVTINKQDAPIGAGPAEPEPDKSKKK